MITERDLTHLQRCIELAEEAVEAGDEPFGSILVSKDNKVLFEDRNRVNTKNDPTRHPEFAIARWAAENLDPKERVTTTVYTSGEHCPMCAAAHGWVELGRIVYASSSTQLTKWLDNIGVGPSMVQSLSIAELVPSIEVEGPVPELAKKVKALHKQFHGSK
ncbi:nucleoside deaminase [Fodinibius sp. Rm-B-1B1-1]|uniref:nucleoside deaminase n=1 Tax=Fodinibius alkaliphilus TaxID=3140241 RepID=UPI00315A1457